MSSTRGNRFFDRAKDLAELEKDREFLAQVTRDSAQAKTIIQTTKNFLANPSQETKDAMDRTPVFTSKNRRTSG